MLFNRVSIQAISHVEPPQILTSEALEDRLSAVYQRLKLPFGRLELQTGIQRRGLWPLGTPPSDMAASAGRQLLEENNLDPKEIDLLIHTSVCRDFLEPATAAMVHQKLELSESCRVFDLSNACLGLMSGIEQAASMIEAGMIKKALLVSGENATALLEETIQYLNSDQSLTRKSIKKYVANLTIGSGAVAMLISQKDQRAAFEILGSLSSTDSSHNHLCQGDGNTQSLMMTTESEQLLHAGVSLAKRNFEKFLTETQWARESIDGIICHQVGVAHRDLLLKTLELPLEKEFPTFDRYGNTGSAALPTALNVANREQFLKAGDHVALLGIGSGLVTTMMAVRKL
jgi:3-oxoacyl-[acyl-carrier-protein] synthase III